MSYRAYKFAAALWLLVVLGGIASQYVNIPAVHNPFDFLP